MFCYVRALKAQQNMKEEEINDRHLFSFLSLSIDRASARVYQLIERKRQVLDQLVID